MSELDRFDPRQAWRKSRFSDLSGCVEVAAATRGKTVAVRDSKDPNGPELRFPAGAWRRFVMILADRA
jgi:Domain of unknown function (DUF397)